MRKISYVILYFTFILNIDNNKYLLRYQMNLESPLCNFLILLSWLFLQVDYTSFCFMYGGFSHGRIYYGRYRHLHSYLSKKSTNVKIFYNLWIFIESFPCWRHKGVECVCVLWMLLNDSLFSFELISSIWYKNLLWFIIVLWMKGT